MLRRSPLVVVLALGLPLALAAQAARHTAPTADPWAPLLRSNRHAAAPTTAAITAADLRTRLFRFADDSMMGRLLGSQGNARGVEYIAHEVERFGLLPAGTDGTFFQNVPVDTRTFDPQATIAIDGVPLVPWVDFLPRDPGKALRPVDGTVVVYAGNWADSTHLLSPGAARGKVVVLTFTGSVPGNPPGTPSRPVVSAYYRDAAAIAIVSLDSIPASTRARYQSEASTPTVRDERTAPIYLYISNGAATRLLGQSPDSATVGLTGKTVSGAFRYRIASSLRFPARNVVALLPGSDRALQGEYVVIGAHNDHIGTTSNGMSDVDHPMAHDSSYVIDHLFRRGGADDPMPVLTGAQYQQVNHILADVRKRSGGRSARIDSIFNGADDDGSGSVSVLEIAQFLASRPVKPKRSILFVWHVGEEENLYGSTWFTDHPAVSRDSIVAELNMDMVGRGGATDQTGNSIAGHALHGGPGYLQVVGSRRLSTELGDLVEAVNRVGHHGLRFDYAMDADHHPQNIYCRSDHYEYARYGIPIAFFTTGGHADYHQLTDEPQYIDYDRMAQVDNFVADLARHVADLGHRLPVDKPKPDPDADCRQ